MDNIIEHEVSLSTRPLASFTGQIISTSSVVGNVTRIMTRHCVMFILCASHWDAVLRLNKYTKDEIVFWRDCIVLSPDIIS